jgi:hypothetical protein
MENYKFLTVFFVFCSAFTAYARLNIHTSLELGRGEASYTDPDLHFAFLYNPAALANNQETTVIPLFIQHSYNTAGQNTLEKVSTFNKKSQLEKIDEINNLLGENLHFDTVIANGVLRQNMSFTLLSSIEYDSLAIGSGLPALEMSVVEAVRFFFTHSITITPELAVGYSLKPTYMIDYYFYKTGSELVNNPKLIDPQKNGKKGAGVGIDAGVIWKKSWIAQQNFSIGLSLFNLGQMPTYASIMSKKLSDNPAPAAIPMDEAFGTSYQFKNISQYVDEVTLSYAYTITEDRFGFVPFPHHLGVMMRAFQSLEIATGLYRGQPTFGLDYLGRFFRAGYAYYREACTDLLIDRIDPRYSLFVEADI